MNYLNLALSLFMLLNMIVGMSRVLHGPTPADRILASQLFGTLGVAMLLLLSAALASPALQDVALVLALLSATATVVFVRRVWVSSQVDGD